ncbi:MAG: DNA polymerase III subunit beta, partial [Ignavibacteriae bacterium]|nr:DNA polymerase III subunit beta [Ignavibacteriota bacterium]
NEQQNILNLNCEKISYSLLITDSSEYPHINFNTAGKPFELKAEDFQNIINKTSHAMSNDETRINLNGIFLQSLDSKLRAVAIDGHRLALLDIKNFENENDTLTDGIIIPKKGITELKKIAELYSGSNLLVSLDESFIYISANDEHILSIRLIARDYPKYQTVIPSKTTYSLKIERNSLLNAVRRIRILSNEKTNGIKATLQKNTMTISANHPSFGHASETVSVDYNGAELDIGFNAKYMLESLAVLEVNEIIFELNNELSPVVVRSEEEPDFLGIIMPLKL